MRIGFRAGMVQVEQGTVYGIPCTEADLAPENEFSVYAVGNERNLASNVAGTVYSCSFSGWG